MSERNKMRIAITGHRPGRIAGRENEIQEWIRRQLISNNCTEALSGMATGTDQIFAKIVEDMGIPLICCYPYKRNKFHPVEDDINAKAYDVRFISDEYSRQSYWIRDKYMVDNCDILLAVFDGKQEGGTWITVDYAKKIDKPIVYFPWRTQVCLD